MSKDQILFASFVAEGFLGDDVFNLESPRNRDNCLFPFYKLREQFSKIGIELKSYDIDNQLPVAFELHLDIYEKNRIKLPSYVILFESPQILPANEKQKLLKKFRYIFTWRDDWVDDKTIIKINIPNKIIVNNNFGWKDRSKLCCMIASNKSTLYKTPLELYSERVNTIRWFEQNAPDDFDLFGSGWDLPIAKPGRYQRFLRKLIFSLTPKKTNFLSFRGSIESKLSILQSYRFSICYENVRDMPGYITEKIWDSFFAGCIPIYWGACNINNYVPEDCFIDRRKFANHEELYDYINSMNEYEYIGYQERISVFLMSGKARQFSTEAFAEKVVSTIAKDIGFEI